MIENENKTENSPPLPPTPKKLSKGMPLWRTVSEVADVIGVDRLVLQRRLEKRGVETCEVGVIVDRIYMRLPAVPLAYAKALVQRHEADLVMRQYETARKRRGQPARPE